MGISATNVLFDHTHLKSIVCKKLDRLNTFLDKKRPNLFLHNCHLNAIEIDPKGTWLCTLIVLLGRSESHVQFLALGQRVEPGVYFNSILRAAFAPVDLS